MIVRRPSESRWEGSQCPSVPSSLNPPAIFSSARSCYLFSQQDAWQALTTTRSRSRSLVDLCYVKSLLQVLLKGRRMTAPGSRAGAGYGAAQPCS